MEIYLSPEIYIWITCFVFYLASKFTIIWFFNWTFLFIRFLWIGPDVKSDLMFGLKANSSMKKWMVWAEVRLLFSRLSGGSWRSVWLFRLVGNFRLNCLYYIYTEKWLCFLKQTVIVDNDGAVLGLALSLCDGLWVYVV